MNSQGEISDCSWGRKLLLILFLGYLFWGKLLPVQGQPLPNNPVPNLPQPAESESPAPQLPPPQEFLPEDFLQPEETIPTIPGTITVKGFKFVGNTAFSQAELAQLTAAFTGEAVSFTELLEARSRITQHYINQGYITSGAYLPANQVIQEGIVTIGIIEGTLAEINIEGLQRLTPNYVRSRINAGVDTPLNVNALVTALEQLRRNPLIENLSAELTASSQVGKSILNLKLERTNPLSVALAINNHQSRTIGTWQQQLQLYHQNLFGWGDSLLLSYGNTGGGQEGGFIYTIPINAKNGTVKLSYLTFAADIIEEPFNLVDLETASEQYIIEFRQPLVNSITEELAWGVMVFHQISKTQLLGVPFPLSPGADADGETRISRIRLFHEWIKRSQRDRVWIRNELSLGLNLLNATQNETAPDSQFLSWRFQGEWLHTFSQDQELVTRFEGQISDRALLSAEDFRIGGASNIRGYRQDLFLVDHGIFASVEYRFPIMRIRQWESVVQGISFVEMAWGGNAGTIPNPDPNYLASVGVGLHWQLADDLRLELSWATPLVELSDRAEERFFFSLSIYLAS